jgi:regulator of cell morphogenesis and NO signaling
MTITKENTVAEVVSKNLGSDHVFSKYNIDFCCGGGLTLEEACAANGVDFENLKAEIEAINYKIAGSRQENEVTVSSLITQLKDEYHAYFYEILPQIVPISAKVAQVHGTQNPELLQINELVKAIEIVLLETTKNAESSLFNALKELDEEQFNKALKKGEIAQHLISDSFKEISKLSNHYEIPSNACNSFKFLYTNLHDFDHQFQKYVHFIMHVFVPKVLDLIAE